MLPAASALAVLAIVLAWPVPVALSRAAWTRRAPGTALVLWQAIALAGGLSMIGSLLVFGLVPFGGDLPHAGLVFGEQVVAGRLPHGADFVEMFALSGAILLGVHLLLSLVRTAMRAERERRRHAHLLRLLSTPFPERPGMRVLDHRAPVAYCLPGAPHAVTVLTAGLIELLSEEELRAVVEHERAHVRQHHHLLLVAFGAWRAALPWFPIANRARDAVGLLVELLADDEARRVVSRHELSRAVARVALASAEARGVAHGSAAGDVVPADPGGAWVDVRIERLTEAAPVVPTALRVVVIAASVALVVMPTALLLQPAFA